jgi:hypothetical protein
MVLSEQLIDLGDTYEESAVTRIFSMKNLSNCSTTFYWYTEHIESDPEGAFVVAMNPKEGTLLYGETMEISMTFSPRQIGEYDIVVPCLLQESDEDSIGIIIKTTIKGLYIGLDVDNPEKQVDIEKKETLDFCHNLVTSCLNESLSEEVADPVYIPEIDFGDVLIYSRKSLSLRLNNLSDCIGFFAATFEKYGAPVEHSRRKKSAGVSFHPLNKAIAG